MTAERMLARMRRGIGVLLCASALALSSCSMPSPSPPPPLPPHVSPPPGKGLAELLFPRDIEQGPLGPSSESESAPRLRELVFQAADAVRLDGSRLYLDVWVTNPTSERIVLHVVPVGGSFPYGGDSPLTFAFDAEAQSIVRYSGQMFPPEPPAPMWIALPAASRVLFRAELDAARYTYEGHPNVTLEWAFHLLRGDAPRGSVAAQMP